MTASDPRVGEIQALAEGLTDLCPEHLRQSIRHVQRNCDIDCNTHEDDWDDCNQPDRYAGGRMAAALASIPYLLAELADRDEKLARVLDACDRVIDNTDGHKPPGPPHPTREQATACRIRAAVAAANGGGE